MARSKLTPEQAKEIRQSTKPVKELAQEYNVTLASIYNIKSGHHYPPPGVPRPVRKAGVGRPRIHHPQLCGCGCGAMTSPGSRYLAGHNARSEYHKANHMPRRPALTADEFVANTHDRCELTDTGYVDENGQPSECLLWTGFVDPRTGYATCHWGKRVSTRHRFIYDIECGPLPDDRNVVVHHKCRQKRCMLTSHMEACTTAKHIRGHMSPLTAEDVAECHRLYAQGVTTRELGRRYGMTQGSMSNVLRGMRWSDCKPAPSAG